MGFTRINRITKNAVHYTWHVIDEYFYSDVKSSDGFYIIPESNYLYKIVLD